MLSSLENKILGSLYGFAIGDAMGATMEFQEKITDESKKIKDLIGGGWLNLSPGETTDDTQMSVCVLKALMEQANNPEKKFMDLVAKNFIDWFDSNPKDIGNTCARVLRVAKTLLDEGNEIHYVAGKMKLIAFDVKALGDGALMRALPCALFNKIWKNLDQAFMTHNNVSQETCIITYDALIKHLLVPVSPLCFSYGLHSIFKIKEPMEPTGCVINTMNNACYYALNCNSFEECIINAVNDGGDADTIAAIAGSIAGAIFGYDSIPKRWKEVFKTNPLNYETIELFEKVPEVLDKLKVY